jgi:hypothetical protein
MILWEDAVLTLEVLMGPSIRDFEFLEWDEDFGVR